MEPDKRLYRSESNRMLAGVCGGLGEFFGIDATLVRLVFVLLAFFGGGGIIAYLVMWLIVPTASKVGIPARDVPREGFEELREGVERGAQGARDAYERWRSKDSGDRERTESAAGEPPAGGPVPAQAPPPVEEPPAPETPAPDAPETPAPDASDVPPPPPAGEPPRG